MPGHALACYHDRSRRRPRMTRFALAWLPLALAACTPTVNPNLAPLANSEALVAVTPGGPVIANFQMDKPAVVGAQEFEASYDVVRKGNGTIAHYGLKSPDGSQLFDPMFPIPVIDHGHV